MGDRLFSGGGGTGTGKTKVTDDRAIRRSANRTFLEILESRRLLSGDGLKGEYFNDVNFAGDPLTRVDAKVDFDWGAGAPDTEIAADNFSVRWTGYVEPEFSEVYTFRTSTDDGVRLWVDGKLLVDDWGEQAATGNSGAITLQAGRKYEIRKEYFESRGKAVASLAWSSESQPTEVIPVEHLYSSATPSPVAAGVGSVTSLALVDSKTLKTIRTIADGDVLDLSTLPGQFSFRALVSGAPVGSVQFEYDGRLERIESHAPYLIAGDSGTEFFAWIPSVGAHSLTVTPFASSGGAGATGPALSVNFTVVTAEPPEVLPPPPSNLSADEVAHDAVSLSWDDNSHDESRFIVERSSDGSVFVPVGQSAANASVFSDDTVDAGRKYWYRVAAVNLSGVSAYTGSLTVTTPTAPLPLPPVPTPTPLIAVTSLTLINADTAKPIMTLADGTALDLSALPTRNLNVRANVSGAVGSVRFTMNGSFVRTESSAPHALAGDNGPNAYHRWTPALGAHALVATPFTLAGANGTAGAGLTVNFTVTESASPTAPAAPTSLVATAASTSKINLAWGDPSDNESGFRVERSTDGVNFTQIASVSANVKAYGSTGLAAGTRYWYRVRAYNGVGNSAYTLVASATTSAETTPPPATKFPTAATTGPTNRSVLVARGSFNVKQAGAVIENFIVKNGGQIIISANNVTLRNFVIENPTTTGAAIKIANGDITGTVIEDGDIFGGKATNAVAGSNFTARRLHIYNMQADAFRVRVNATIEGCLIHDLAKADGAHGDGVQMYPTDGGNIIIRNNSIDARGANSALFQVDGGWLIENNYFNGGNFTIQCTGQIENVFRNNTFGRGAQYGPIRVGAGDDELLTWENNVWADTGALVKL